ncbi:hypothetical protein KKA14_03700 [bacterium]|nr:hypothetical protein [bacterium]
MKEICYGGIDSKIEFDGKIIEFFELFMGSKLIVSLLIFRMIMKREIH